MTTRRLLCLPLCALGLLARPLPAQGDVLFTVPESVPGEGLGSALAVVGDWDGDGLPDLAVGAPGLVAGMTGRVYLLSGADGSPLRTWNGLHPDDRFGATLAAIADGDGDGIPDLAIGSPDFDGGQVDQGRVAVIGSATRAARYVVRGKALEHFGEALHACHDVDGDGVDDWLAGGPGDLVQAGVAQVRSTADGSLLWDLVVSAGSNPPTFGASVGAIPDTDSDGVADLLVGEMGAAHVFSGALGFELTAVTGPSWLSFGASVAGLPDQDGDGGGELAVLQYGCGPNCIASFVNVFNGTNGQPLFAAQGLGPITAVRDFSGDGVVDLDSAGLLISTGTRTNLQNLSFWLGERDQVVVLTSDQIGDLDGDGIRERVLGAPRSYGALPPAVYFLKGRSLYLHLNRAVVTVGRPSDLVARVGEGRPRAPALLMLESVNGTPFFSFVGPAQPLGNDGSVSWSAPWVSLIGLQIGLRGFGVDALGRVQMTTPDLITIW